MLLLARLVCSDPLCAEELEESVAGPAELDALACACGCTLELLGVSLDARVTGVRGAVRALIERPALTRLAA